MRIFILNNIVSVFFICCQQASAQEMPLKDTLYFVSFVHLFEIDYEGNFHYRSDSVGRIIKEKETMDESLKNKLGKYFILLPLQDSCHSEIKTTEISRRDVSLLKMICNKCSLKKNVILFIDDCNYMSNKTLQKMNEWEVKNLSRPPSTPVTGMWGDIKVIIYSPQQNDFTHQEVFMTYSFEDRTDPSEDKKLLYNRVAKKMGKILINAQKNKLHN